VTFAKQLLIDDSGIAIEASITFQCTQRPHLETLPYLDVLLSLSSNQLLDKDAMLACTRDDSVDERRQSLNERRSTKKIRNRRPFSIKNLYWATVKDEGSDFLDLRP
jgi:hypothetical protein